MTDNITIPRSVVEAAVEALDYAQVAVIVYPDGEFYTDTLRKLLDAPRVEIDELRAEVDRLKKGSAELSVLLHEIDAQCGNGMMPWQIEDAYEAYDAVMKE